MIQDASKILQLIIEFCRSNLDILMIGGVALVGLIVIASGIKYFMNGDKDGDDVDFQIDEAELMGIVQQVKQKHEIDSADVEVVLPPLTARIMAEDEPVEVDEPVAADKEAEVKALEPELEVVAVSLPPLTAAVEPAEDEVVVSQVEPEVIEKHEPQVEPQIEPRVETPAKVELEKKMEEKPQVKEQVKPQVKAEVPAMTVPSAKTESQKNSATIESLIQEIATLAGSGVSEVEIKISGTKVKILYNQDEHTDDADATKECVNDEAKESADDIARTYDNEAQGLDDDKKSNNGAGAIKFGPDNINRSRSGRVFSEVELQQQIRD